MIQVDVAETYTFLAKFMYQTPGGQTHFVNIMLLANYMFGIYPILLISIYLPKCVS